MTRKPKRGAQTKTPAVAGALVPNPRNPRVISEAALDRLRLSMERYGDLSGIVYNRRTRRLVGAHQRLRHFDPTAPITLVQEFPKPTATGTVAVGYVEREGERWTYRIVDVEPARETEMMIAANAHGGAFDEIQLGSLLRQLGPVGDETAALGFDPISFAALLKAAAEPEAPTAFPVLSPDLEAEHRCPQCGYEWRGR